MIKPDRQLEMNAKLLNKRRDCAYHFSFQIFISVFYGNLPNV